MRNRVSAAVVGVVLCWAAVGLAQDPGPAPGPAPTPSAPPEITGPATVGPHRLVRLELKGDYESVRWNVTPRRQADGTPTNGGRSYVFVGPPGVYDVLAVTLKGKTLDQAEFTVEITGGTPGPNPEPGPGPPPDPDPPPGPVRPPVPPVFGLALWAADATKATVPAFRPSDAMMLATLLDVLAEPASQRGYVRPGHDDLQGYLRAALTSCRKAGGPGWAPWCDAVAGRLTGLGADGAWSDDDGWWDAARAAQALMEVADGLRAVANKGSGSGLPARTKRLSEPARPGVLDMWPRPDLTPLPGRPRRRAA